MTIPQAFDLALQHHRAGRLADAEALYRHILTMQPQHADALHLLGEIANQMGQSTLAVDLIGRAIKLNPLAAHYYINLGNALQSKRQFAPAIAAYQTSIRLNPNIAQGYNGLGAALLEEGESELSAAALRNAIRIDPTFGEAHNNLGLCLTKKGQFHEAIAACRTALRCKPTLVEAHSNLGNALKEVGEFEAAIAAYDASLRLRPEWPEALYNKGCALQEKRQWEAAEGLFRAALRGKPDLAVAWNNLGIVLKEQGNLDAAINSHRKAMALNPEKASFHSNLIYTLHFQPDCNNTKVAEEHRRWTRQFSEPLRQSLLPHSNDRNPERRLRIGYVSPDFRDHVVGWYLSPLFQRHDRRNFEILCYSGVVRPDELTDEFRQLAEQWRSAVGVPDEALAEMIRNDGVDILVDLTQHMAGNRLPVFARKAAPVQVSFAGYPESTGLEAIEYRISDRNLEAGSMDGGAGSVVAGLFEAGLAGSAELGTGIKERVCLIDSFWCYDPCGVQMEINPLPAQRGGMVTFGSLNNFCKVNERVLSLWARVLARVKDSRLVISSPVGSHRQRTLEAFEREGVEARRVEFVDLRPLREYLELYHRLDIVLDTFPYNGGVTTCDALWMGVPVVSMAGMTPVSRAGLSILTNLGLPEFVASSETEYVNIAERLARDLPHLESLRSTLRDRMENSVLMDAPLFARQIEQAYREMWQAWCAGQSPLPPLGGD
jgi:protein O-GlcNAc transferase